MKRNFFLMVGCLLLGVLAGGIIWNLRKRLHPGVRGDPLQQSDSSDGGSSGQPAPSPGVERTSDPNWLRQGDVRVLLPESVEIGEPIEVKIQFSTDKIPPGIQTAFLRGIAVVRNREKVYQGRLDVADESTRDKAQFLLRLPKDASASAGAGGVVTFLLNLSYESTNGESDLVQGVEFKVLVGPRK